LLHKLKDLIIDWVQEGFQEFFQNLEKHFALLSGSSNDPHGKLSASDHLTQSPDKLPTGLVLVLSQLAVFIEQSAIPKITEVTSSSVANHKHFLSLQR
jgi:vacuolar protein sorting-associated protein 51